ncbi:MAG: TM2 domain-containing protein [Cyanobacteriota bacterium]|nr:TM2 domain-containing protein [Cyanobacteriota bacterium]
MESRYLVTVPQRSVGMAYALWCLGFFGFSGIHRLYAGKTGSGLLWFFTLGWLFIGQLLDLFFIPGMVEEFNLKQRLLYGSPPPTPANPPLPNPPRPLKGQALMREIMRLAQDNQGILTVSQAIIQVNADFDDIENAFRELVRRGLTSPENNLENGSVEYHFSHLQARRLG